MIRRQSHAKLLAAPSASPSLRGDEMRTREGHHLGIMIEREYRHFILASTSARTVRQLLVRRKRPWRRYGFWPFPTTLSSTPNASTNINLSRLTALIDRAVIKPSASRSWSYPLHQLYVANIVFRDFPGRSSIYFWHRLKTTLCLSRGANDCPTATSHHRLYHIPRMHHVYHCCPASSKTLLLVRRWPVTSEGECVKM
jgi:hypothetical protein